MQGFNSLLIAFLLLGVTEVIIKPAAIWVINKPLDYLKSRLSGVFDRINERFIVEVEEGQEPKDVVVNALKEELGREPTPQELSYVISLFDPTKLPKAPKKETQSESTESGTTVSVSGPGSFEASAGVQF